MWDVKTFVMPIITLSEGGSSILTMWDVKPQKEKKITDKTRNFHINYVGCKVVSQLIHSSTVQTSILTMWDVKEDYIDHMKDWGYTSILTMWDVKYCSC